MTTARTRGARPRRRRRGGGGRRTPWPASRRRVVAVRVVSRSSCRTTSTPSSARAVRTRTPGRGRADGPSVPSRRSGSPTTTSPRTPRGRASAPRDARRPPRSVIGGTRAARRVAHGDADPGGARIEGDDHAAASRSPVVTLRPAAPGPRRARRRGLGGPAARERELGAAPAAAADQRRPGAHEATRRRCRRWPRRSRRSLGVGRAEHGGRRAASWRRAPASDAAPRRCGPRCARRRRRRWRLAMRPRRRAARAPSASRARARRPAAGRRASRRRRGGARGRCAAGRSRRRAGGRGRGRAAARRCPVTASMRRVFAPIEDSETSCRPDRAEGAGRGCRRRTRASAGRLARPAPRRRTCRRRTRPRPCASASWREVIVGLDGVVAEHVAVDHVAGPRRARRRRARRGGRSRSAGGPARRASPAGGRGRRARRAARRAAGAWRVVAPDRLAALARRSTATRLLARVQLAAEHARGAR